MKQQLTYFSPEFITAQNLSSNEIAQRFEIISGKHVALTEKLRELHSKQAEQTNRQRKWHDLKNQVVNLRDEFESFKQVF